LISGLVAVAATVNTTWFFSETKVPFSVIAGLLMMS
jgi:hypothetical protein